MAIEDAGPGIVNFTTGWASAAMSHGALDDQQERLLPLLNHCLYCSQWLVAAPREPCARKQDLPSIQHTAQILTANLTNFSI